jgi:uncharacterized protein (TIGR03083 family)
MDLDEMAERELSGTNPYDALDEESARLEAFLGELDDEGWAVPTRCDGWSRRDLVAHLAATEEYHRACLDDALGPLLERGMAAGATDVHSFNALGVTERAGRSPSEVAHEWKVADAGTRQRFRERDGGQMSTMAGAYPVRWQAFHIASELATHADDMGVPVPSAAVPSRLAWRAAFSRFALVERSPTSRSMCRRFPMTSSSRA